MELIRKELNLGMVELLDALMMKALNIKYKFTYAEKPTLYLEFIGWSEAVLKEQESLVYSITKRYGGGSFNFAATPSDREYLFKARKSALFAASVLRPNTEPLTTDVCVPISKLPECIIETHKDLQKSYIPAPLVGHIGDGNFHLIMLIDVNVKEDIEEAKRLNDRLIRRAISMGGTSTGEHGVGVGKKKISNRRIGRNSHTNDVVTKTRNRSKGINESWKSAS